MKKNISFFELGGTLYTPATNKNIKEMIEGTKFPGLKSMVVCFEDSIVEKDLIPSMDMFQKTLNSANFGDVKVFVRPRNVTNLKFFLTHIKNIEKIDGFSLPKFDSSNIAEYLSLFIGENSFYLMPILETKDVFSSLKLQSILTELRPFKKQILSVRIGGEDILQHLGMMRSGKDTSYDIMPLYLIMTSILNVFKPEGFNVSAPVFPSFADRKIFEKELCGDIEHQIFNKTIIHPEHIEQVNEKYKVTPKEYNIAKKIIYEDCGVFSEDDKMYEKATHSKWANNILERYKYYGCIKENNE